MPSARNATSTGSPVRAAPNARGCSRQHRADEQEKRSLVHTGIFAGRERRGPSLAEEALSGRVESGERLLDHPAGRRSPRISTSAPCPPRRARPGGRRARSTRRPCGRSRPTSTYVDRLAAGIDRLVAVRVGPVGVDDEARERVRIRCSRSRSSASRPTKSPLSKRDEPLQPGLERRAVGGHVRAPEPVAFSKRIDSSAR